MSLSPIEQHIHDYIFNEEWVHDEDAEYPYSITIPLVHEELALNALKDMIEEFLREKMGIKEGQYMLEAKSIRHNSVASSKDSPHNAVKLEIDGDISERVLWSNNLEGYNEAHADEIYAQETYEAVMPEEAPSKKRKGRESLAPPVDVPSDDEMQTLSEALGMAAEERPPIMQALYNALNKKYTMHPTELRATLGLISAARKAGYVFDSDFIATALNNGWPMHVIGLLRQEPDFPKEPNTEPVARPRPSNGTNLPRYIERRFFENGNWHSDGEGGMFTNIAIPKDREDINLARFADVIRRFIREELQATVGTINDDVFFLTEEGERGTPGVVFVAISKAEYERRLKHNSSLEDYRRNFLDTQPPTQIDRPEDRGTAGPGSEPELGG